MKEDKKGNVFDRIFKENAEALFIPLIRQELNISIKSFTPLKEKIPKTIEREVDFLYEVLSEQDERFILHIEFQTTRDKDMIYRMVEYHGLILRKFKLPIRHVLIYLGKGDFRSRKHLFAKEVFSRFELINLHALDAQKLLGSQIPEVIILALLGNFQQEQSEIILRAILLKLKSIGLSKHELIKYMQQLTILSRLRNLDVNTLNTLEDMPVIIDIEKDTLYNQGMEKGRQEGMEKTIEVIQYFKQGKSTQEIESITNLPKEEVLRIIQKLTNL